MKADGLLRWADLDALDDDEGEAYERNDGRFRGGFESMMNGCRPVFAITSVVTKNTTLRTTTGKVGRGPLPPAFGWRSQIFFSKSES